MRRYGLVVPILAVLAVAVAAVISGLQNQEQGAAKEEFFNYTVRFCSEYDCTQALIWQLKAAKETVSCAFYRADEPVIRSIPKTVEAEIVVDEKAKAAVANFSLVKIYKSKSKGIMHNKYCIIDNARVITGSFNPTAAAKNDYNNLLIINSTILAGFYSSNFEKLKLGNNKKTPTAAAVANAKMRKAAILNDTPIEVRFCPEDNCAEAVTVELRAAKESILFAAYSFTHPEIANELILKKSEGIAVAGVIEKSTTGSEYSKHAMMAANGINVKLESSKRLMHHKFFVIDNETVITGSFNPTKNADERNDENIIIIRNKPVAEKFVEEFGRIRSH